tara:strand:+ start:208 stop:942 length:735 start_codon:yes stop_codon:yes gene_type:complete
MPKILNYNFEKYNFSKIVADIYGVEDLTKLHQLDPSLCGSRPLEQSNEAETSFHKTFYGKLNDGWPELINAFEGFIKNEVSPLFRGSFLYQKTPTFRAHVPNQTAVSKWHFDSDPNHGHPDWEINIQISLTDMNEQNCMWIESIPGLGDFGPVQLEYGQYALFDGNKCIHGNKRNTSDDTRVSFDFRVIPCEMYDDKGEHLFTIVKTDEGEEKSKHGYVGKLNSPHSYYGKAWEVGGYYSICEK